MKNYTNFNELMCKVLAISNKRGVRDQAGLNEIIKEVFTADAENRKN